MQLSRPRAVVSIGWMLAAFLFGAALDLLLSITRGWANPQPFALAGMGKPVTGLQGHFTQGWANLHTALAGGVPTPQQVQAWARYATRART